VCGGGPPRRRPLRLRDPRFSRRPEAEVLRDLFACALPRVRCSTACSRRYFRGGPDEKTLRLLGPNRRPGRAPAALQGSSAFEFRDRTRSDPGAAGSGCPPLSAMRDGGALPGRRLPRGRRPGRDGSRYPAPAARASMVLSGHAVPRGRCEAIRWPGEAHAPAAAHRALRPGRRNSGAAAWGRSTSAGIGSSASSGPSNSSSRASPCRSSASGARPRCSRASATPTSSRCTRPASTRRGPTS